MNRNNHIFRFLIRTFVLIIITLLFVTLLSFLLMRLSPVDPATAYVKRNSAIVTDEQIDAARIELGLDKPLAVQYINWLEDAIHWNFGTSLGTGRPVAEELSKTVPVTMMVVAVSGVLMAVGAILFGMLGYLWRNRAGGKILSVLSVVGISVPAFYLSTAFLDIFAVKFGIVQVAGNSGAAKYLPVALCLSISGICFYGQLLSGSLQREMEQDYALYARSRGLTDRRILFFHALPHALVDLLPSFAQMLGLCLAGAAIVERVFSLSGMGYLIIDSVIKRDSPVIHAAVLVLALVLILFDTAANIIQRFLQKDTRSKETMTI